MPSQDQPAQSRCFRVRQNPEAWRIQPEPERSIMIRPPRSGHTMKPPCISPMPRICSSLHPPHVTDEPHRAMKTIGLEPCKSFDVAKLDPAVQRRWRPPRRTAQNLMAWKVPTWRRVANGWSG